jgi:hypothetical protein
LFALRKADIEFAGLPVHCFPVSELDLALVQYWHDVKASSIDRTAVIKTSREFAVARSQRQNANESKRGQRMDTSQ